MSTQHPEGFGPNSEPIDKRSVSVEETAHTEVIQEEALRLTLEEFHEGVLGNDVPRDLVITAAMKTTAFHDTSKLPDFAVRPYMFQDKMTGDLERGLQIVMSGKAKLEEVPQLSLGFGLFAHVIVLAETERDGAPEFGVVKSFSEAVAGRPLSKSEPPTEEERARILGAANEYMTLISRFTQSCDNRGVHIGIGPSGAPELMSKLERMGIFDEGNDTKDSTE